MSGEGGPARGTPAPFSQEQVDALVRGKLQESDTAAVLESHPRPAPEAPRAAEQAAPVEVSVAGLEELAHGKTPEELASRLEDLAAETDPASAAPVERSERPSQAPPSEAYS